MATVNTEVIIGEQGYVSIYSDLSNLMMSNDALPGPSNQAESTDI